MLPADVVPEHYDIAVVPHAAQLTFDGHIAIDVTVAKPTNTIKLNAADLSFGKVALTGEAAAPKVSYDATQETATLTFAAPVAAGHHALTIDYTGKINQHAAGLFALDYDTAGGKKRALFTQFENSDARRFIPSWDEPARKATFTLTATVPANEMAVSNMPVAKTEPLPGGLARVHFAHLAQDVVLSSLLRRRRFRARFEEGQRRRYRRDLQARRCRQGGLRARRGGAYPALLRRLFRREISAAEARSHRRSRARASSSARWRTGARSSISNAIC